MGAYFLGDSIYFQSYWIGVVFQALYKRWVLVVNDIYFIKYIQYVYGTTTVYRLLYC